jgi:hypothetical protein
MDDQNLDNQQESCPLDLALLAFMGIISFPFFFILVIDLLAYGLNLFNHIWALISTGVILGDDLCILEGLLEMKNLLKKKQIDKGEVDAASLLVSLFLILLNAPLLFIIVFFFSNYLPSNLKEIFINGSALVVLLIIIYIVIKIYKFPSNDINNESENKGKN